LIVHNLITLTELNNIYQESGCMKPDHLQVYKNQKTYVSRTSLHNYNMT